MLVDVLGVNFKKYVISIRNDLIQKFRNKYLMFYNGNNFGEKGIGLAEIAKKNLVDKIKSI